MEKISSPGCRVGRVSASCLKRCSSKVMVFLSASTVSLSFVMANSRSLSFQSHFAAVTSGVVGKLKPSFAVMVTLTV